MRRFKRLLAWLWIILLLLSGCSGKGTLAPYEPPAEAVLSAALGQEYEAPKNVIFMIADGMGPNDLILCEREIDEALLVNEIPYQGFAVTHSASHAVTDSAAAATALATGVKTTNGMVGRSPDGKALSNLCEIAREEGKKVGVVTNDLATGATPSSFTVHHSSRHDAAVIAEKIVDFAPDFLAAQDYQGFEKALGLEGRKQLEGYSLSKTDATAEAALERAGERPCFCFSDAFSWEKADDTLVSYTQAALDFLENEKGFFLMIESCGTDKSGHENDMEGKLQSVVTLDRAVAAVLSFMREHPDTLLIITSDHETGGVQLPKEGEAISDQLFTTTKHTAEKVRVFALGAGAEYFHGKTVDNTDIAKFAIKAVKGEPLE